jgi:predicted hotdog family 3-hydroxylacyl-ACP dehydratase
MTAPQTLSHADIARRIPHQAAMCLLGSVTAWDEHAIACEALSHRAADNPLRAHGRLGAACGVEYAAQAMALHGALIAESLAGPGDAPRAGYLASLRSVTLHVDRLDTFAGPLRVEAERMTGDSNTVLYSFSVNFGDTCLLSGRAAVVLDATALLPATVGTAKTAEPGKTSS